MRLNISILVAGLLFGVQAQAALYDSGTISLGSMIPTTDPIGSSTITVSGLSHIDPGSVRVHLDFSGGFVGDLWVQLVGPTGTQSILLNRTGLTAAQPGGYVNAGFVGWLSDAAAGGNIHANGGSYSSGAGQISGDFAPDGRNISSASSGVAFDGGSPTRMLSQFDNTNPNGDWTLRFFDEVAGAGSGTTINSWQLQLTAVPEPVNVALILFAAALGSVKLFRVRRTLAARLGFNRDR